MFPNRLLKHSTCPNCGNTIITKSTTSLPSEYYQSKGCEIDQATGLHIIKRIKPCNPICL